MATIKNKYNHSIDLKKLHIRNMERKAFAQAIIDVEYRGYEVEQLGDGRTSPSLAEREHTDSLTKRTYRCSFSTRQIIPSGKSHTTKSLKMSEQNYLRTKFKEQSY